MSQILFYFQDPLMVFTPKMSKSTLIAVRMSESFPEIVKRDRINSVTLAPCCFTDV